MRPTGNDTDFDGLARRSEAHKQGGEPGAPGEAAIVPGRLVNQEPASEPVPDNGSDLEVHP